MVFLSIALAFCININTAPIAELEKIKHVGQVRAEQIVRLRQERLFSSLDELGRVTGLGYSRVSDIKEQGSACVGPQPEQKTEAAKEKTALAVSGNPADIKRKGAGFFPLFAALPLAFFSGFAILLLKNKLS